ncbi:hypothetical protein TorRG33x02_141560, partial [Trema orientale]
NFHSEISSNDKLYCGGTTNSLKKKVCLWCDLTHQSSYPNSQKNLQNKNRKKEYQLLLSFWVALDNEISLLQFHIFNSSPGQYGFQSTRLFRRKWRYLSQCNNCLSLTKLPILLKDFKQGMYS